MNQTVAGPPAGPEPPFPGFLLVPIALSLAAAILAVRPPGEQPIAPAAPSILTSPGSPLAGYGCTACHALEPGQDAPAGPSLAGTAGRGGQRISDPHYTGTASDAESWIAESIMDHCADVAVGWSCEGVDAYGNWLSSEEVALLVDQVGALASGGP